MELAPLRGGGAVPVADGRGGIGGSRGGRVGGGKVHVGLEQPNLGDPDPHRIASRLPLGCQKCDLRLTTVDSGTI